MNYFQEIDNLKQLQLISINNKTTLTVMFLYSCMDVFKPSCIINHVLRPALVKNFCESELLTSATRQLLLSSATQIDADR